MRVNNDPIFTASDASVTQTSVAFPVNQVIGYSAQFVWTGSPVGTIKIQVSDDPGTTASSPSQQPTHWTDYSGSTISVSGAGNGTFNVNDAFYNWIRFVYTASSGSGTISGILNTKGI